MSANKETTIGWLIFGGLLVILVGIGATSFLTFAGALRFMNSQYSDPAMWLLKGLGFLIIGAGVTMVVVGLVTGIKEGRVSEQGGSGRVRFDPYVKVIARFGLLNPAYPPGDNAHGVPYPGTFVTDPSGTVTARNRTRPPKTGPFGGRFFS